MFFNKMEVSPYQIGFLYKENKLKQQLNPGVYQFFDWKGVLKLVLIPTLSKFFYVTNQEVLTKDNIALRFSYMVQYKIDKPDVFVTQMQVFENNFNAYSQAEQVVHNFTQAYVREQIVEISSEDLNENRSQIFKEVPEDLNEQLADFGIVVEHQFLRDITFPKAIQTIFAKRLEAQVRAKTDLENARTTVATARTLKNASALLKGDENIKFIQLLETMTKISAKGNHTFVMSDFIKSVTS